MKTRTKKQHEAEIIAEEMMIEAIRHADYFLASLFVGRGEYDKARANTVLQAVVAADLLKSAHPNNTRTPIIYAVAKDRVATMITYELIDRLSVTYRSAPHVGASRCAASRSHQPHSEERTMQTQTTIPAKTVRAMSALATLNALRVAAGKPPLKAWKESKAKLDDAIVKAHAVAPVTAKTPDAPVSAVLAKLDDANRMVVLSPEARKAAWAANPPRKSTVELKSVAISKTPTKEQETIMAANKAQGKRKASKSARARYDWEGAEEKATKGTLATPPDMSAPTHKHYVAKLDEVCKLARAGKLKELQSFKVSDRDDGSPGLVKRYQKLAIVALKAKA